MTLPHDAHEQITKIDQQILHLLEQRAQICQRGDGLSPEEEEEFSAAWLEDALDKDLNEDDVEKIGRQITKLCRTARDA